jgi:hypothetical protein
MRSIAAPSALASPAARALSSAPTIALEGLAPRHRRQAVRTLSADPRQADGIPRRERDARQRRRDQRRVRELGPRRPRPAVRHRGGRIDAEPQRAIGLGLELAHHVLVVAEQRAPIDEAQIVPRHVGPLPAELHAGALAHAAVHARRTPPRRSSAPGGAAARASPSRWGRRYSMSRSRSEGGARRRCTLDRGGAQDARSLSSRAAAAEAGRDGARHLGPHRAIGPGAASTAKRAPRLDRISSTPASPFQRAITSCSPARSASWRRMMAPASSFEPSAGSNP